MKSAAVHDEHAPLSGLTRAAQELLHRPFRLVARHAVEIHVTLDGELPRRSLRARFASRSAMALDELVGVGEVERRVARDERPQRVDRLEVWCQIAPAAGGGGGGATRPGPDRAAHARGGALPQLALGRLLARAPEVEEARVRHEARVAPASRAPSACRRGC